MEIFNIEEFINAEKPNSGTRYRREILTSKQKASNLAGILVALGQGDQVPYHYHNKRESIIITLTGEATEIVEGKEITIKANDILYIPAGEKHGTVNKTDKVFRYLEIFTCPPVMADHVEVK
ncbi:cupin domain-containing protein [Chloroflexota bacterium]